MRARELGLGGHSSSFGERGIEKRLTALRGLTALSGSKLLDVGCANGTYTVRLAQGFDAVCAIDVEPTRLDEFRAEIVGTSLERKIEIRKMPVEELEYASASFDVVTAIEVLEHVGDLRRSIAEIHRVLEPGGRFLITSPNRYFPFETHGFIVRGRRLPPSRGPFLPWIVPLHNRLADARSFTVRGLAPLIEQHGFELIGSDYIMPPFDRSRIGASIRPLVDRIERSPLKFFGMALVLAFCKRE